MGLGGRADSVIRRSKPAATHGFPLRGTGARNGKGGTRSAAPHSNRDTGGLVMPLTKPLFVVDYYVGQRVADAPGRGAARAAGPLPGTAVSRLPAVGSRRQAASSRRNADGWRLMGQTHDHNFAARPIPAGVTPGRGGSHFAGRGRRRKLPPEATCRAPQAILEPLPRCNRKQRGLFAGRQKDRGSIPLMRKSLEEPGEQKK